jgi:hypothetical protein
MDSARTLACALALLIAAPPLARDSSARQPAPELEGLWEARLRLGPDTRGPLHLRQRNGGWEAEIAGRLALAKVAEGTLTFELPDGAGAFRGRFDADGARLAGHWIQPATPAGGPYASPVMLTRAGGLLAAGWGTEPGGVVAKGTYDAERDVLSLYFPSRGGTLDFERVVADEPTGFYPRGRPTAVYAYSPPRDLDDGWPTASVGDVGISRTAIERSIRSILESPQAPMTFPTRAGGCGATSPAATAGTRRSPSRSSIWQSPRSPVTTTQPTRLERPGGDEARDRGSRDGFGARLVVVEDPDEYRRRWLGVDIPKLESVSEVDRGDSIGAFVVFSGCKPDVQGVCNLEADFTLYRPDGRVAVEQLRQPLWERVASPAPNLALGRAFLGFQPGTNAPRGEWRVRATVLDRNAGVSLELERRVVVR